MHGSEIGLMTVDLPSGYSVVSSAVVVEIKSAVQELSKIGRAMTRQCTSANAVTCRRQKIIT
jgi:hypothetical protein